MLLLFASIWRFCARLFTWNFNCEINMNDSMKFQTLASLTMNLSKDIYSETIEKAVNDDNFTIFFNQTNYYEQGRIVANFSANASSFMPKILIWDWKGNKTAEIPGARIIVIRGTQSLQEWKGNFDCEEVNGRDAGVEIDGYFHKNFLNVSKEIWERYNKYIIFSHLPVIITGHSRGAGIAEVLHVIAKRKLQNTLVPIPIYCMAHAPPPSMSLNEADSRELAKDIYGFINGDDVVPRMFVGNIIDYFNGYQMYGSGLLSLCNLFYSKEQCSVTSTLKISIITKYITKLFPKMLRSIIMNATLQMEPRIFEIMKKFRYESTNVNINKQTGNVFHLNWKQLPAKTNEVNGCVIRPLMETRLDDPKNLTPINIGIQFWKYKNLIEHHNPSYYHHAFIDPVCSY